MNSGPRNEQYDVIIIGAGLSGLAAGIRLAHFDRHVCILERHSRIGGLNSFFRRGPHLLDTGLHAMTNFASPGEKRAPLNRLLRQLRLPYDFLELRPQRYSTIRFPDVELKFTNEFEVFEAAVAEAFPKRHAEFRRLVDAILRFDAYSLFPERLSTRAVCAAHVGDPRLIDMILCPIMFYGNADEHDMDFALFCVLFRSVFLEGLSRPAGGMRPVLEQLAARFRECGGELITGCGVRSLEVRDGRIAAAALDSGARIETETVLSCAGYVETLALCAPAPPEARTWPRGRLSLVELIVGLDRPASELGFTPSTLFWSDNSALHYACPSGPVDRGGGVVCAAENFAGSHASPDTTPTVRLSSLANPEYWLGLAPEAYREAKGETLEEQMTVLERFVPGLRAHTVFTDLMTPRTIHRFTGHVNGALYGSPRKIRDGSTPVEGLFVCGTDQGFLGIVGSLLSGVSMANYRILQRA
ncbi:MAG: NAD(P)/FAD-dependent oxidoreductase [Kiritimatiellaeota bacterium]|nr:NAD(P)/FAD-dependent oxidoreductase [Kiritimatiellota bacterium]